MRYWLVMPAAGTGRRFGEPVPKQYADLEGRPVIEWALAPFLAEPACEGAIVAIADSDRHWERVRSGLRPAGAAKLHVIQGGSERAESVRLALSDLRGRVDASTWVLVHDAARPCVSAADIQALLAAGLANGEGALLAAPLADTLKRADAEESNVAVGSNVGPGASVAAGSSLPRALSFVNETLPRSGLWCAQTPQMFRLDALLDALEHARGAGRSPTDESQAMEWVGMRPVLVAATNANPKITTRADLDIARALLRARGGVSP